MSSPSTLIREAIVERLSGLSWLPVASVRRQPRPQLQESDLPALLVILIDETETPEDDDNVGEPRFLSNITVGISLVTGEEMPDVLDADLDDLVDRIRSTLLCDPTFVRGVDLSKAPDDPERYPLFEAVTRIRRGRLFPQDGATYFAEGRLEISFRSRTAYKPVLDDELELVTFSGRPAGSSAQALAIRGRIEFSDD
ncbi:hypothetical protein [Methylobacterium gnaphalii]|uniref:Uncharacterized protein n=1 Tax=Methylobacterium gnaphalii TaxID=1010610 RepID=A0A512JIR0_9HYPH|nr:hypothetical protein [Methylobacterium gnaphalii]GEP09813.1 hypothetical protein MGN01_16580 [Methylobacterium gnaphalii]GJD67272.1 hypothetical protein MMMDOFMJ_0186 [Methylobacterium gnaphalii]GLS49843.1 hypothetical protein GCM10007885_26950 [Methylobacterium gnaphalii]